MTLDEVKAAIRRGDATPNVPRDLFESAYEAIVHELHPDWHVRTLSESRESGGLPEGVHARVAAMLDGRREQVRPLTEARSDLKDDGLFDPPGNDLDTIGKILKAAAERYKQANDPETIRTRALTRDKVSYARPKPWRFVPVTLTEALTGGETLPEHIHGLIASRLPNRGGR